MLGVLAVQHLDAVVFADEEYQAGDFGELYKPTGTFTCRGIQVCCLLCVCVLLIVCVVLIGCCADWMLC